MKRTVCHIVTALGLVSLLLSCGGRTRIIPRDVLADIYADMFLADQWLNDHPGERKKADTTLFYDPIIARYGYTYEDFDATVKKYLEDPERFAKVFKTASDRLRAGHDRFAAKAKRKKDIEEFNEAFKRYVQKDFDTDTILWKRHADSLGLDTLVLDSLALDSLRRDSLRLDSIAREVFVRDSLQRDSVRRDSLKRLYRQRDSLLRSKSRDVTGKFKETVKQ